MPLGEEEKVGGKLKSWGEKKGGGGVVWHEIQGCPFRV